MKADAVSQFAKHPYFDMFMHTDKALAALLGADLAVRETLHEWPLSCVQRLETADGQNWIYKVQSSPTVEPEIYQAVHGDLLPQARVLYRSAEHACMLIEPAQGTRLDAMHLSRQALVSFGHAVLDRITTIDQKVPVFLDIATPRKGLDLIETVCSTLRMLITGGKLTTTREEDVCQVEQVANSSDFAAAWDGPIGLVHGDLSSDNLFVRGDGRCTVIDWQRPLRGPTALDMAQLLASEDYPLRDVFSPQLLALRRLLQINWLAQCKARWFPQGESYDSQIAGLAACL